MTREEAEKSLQEKIHAGSYQRIAELEQALAKRDKKIEDLERRIAKLDDSEPATTPYRSGRRQTFRSRADCRDEGYGEGDVSENQEDVSNCSLPHSCFEKC